MPSEHWTKKYDPYEFEEFVAELWESKGYETSVRKGSNDRGIDVEASKNDRKVLIQAKLYSPGNKIGSKDVRRYATLYQQVPDADNVVIVTSSTYTTEAKELAEDLDVRLVDDTELNEMDNERSAKSDSDTGGSSYDYSDKKSSSSGQTYTKKESLPAEIRDRISHEISEFRESEIETGTLRVNWMKDINSNIIYTTLVQNRHTTSVYRKNSREGVKSGLYAQRKLGLSNVFNPVGVERPRDYWSLYNFQHIARIGIEEKAPVNISLHKNSELIDDLETSEENKTDVLRNINSEYNKEIKNKKIELMKDEFHNVSGITKSDGFDINKSTDYTCPVCSSTCYSGKCEQSDREHSEIRFCIYCQTLFTQDKKKWVSKSVEI